MTRTRTILAAALFLLAPALAHAQMITATYAIQPACSGHTEYVFEKQVDAQPFLTFAATPATQTQIQDATLQVGHVYAYRFQCRNQFGGVPFSPASSAATMAPTGSSGTGSVSVTVNP